MAYVGHVALSVSVQAGSGQASQCDFGLC